MRFDAPDSVSAPCARDVSSTRRDDDWLVFPPAGIMLSRTHAQGKTGRRPTHNRVGHTAPHPPLQSLLRAVAAAGPSIQSAPISLSMFSMHEFCGKASPAGSASPLGPGPSET
jgi:hypothetical protein